MLHLYVSDFGDRATCGANVSHGSIVTDPKITTCHLCLAGRLGSLQADIKEVEQRLTEVLALPKASAHCPECGGAMNPLDMHPGAFACSACEHVSTNTIVPAPNPKAMR